MYLCSFPVFWKPVGISQKLKWFRQYKSIVTTVWFAFQRFQIFQSCRSHLKITFQRFSLNAEGVLKAFLEQKKREVKEENSHVKSKQNECEKWSKSKGKTGKVRILVVLCVPILKAFKWKQLSSYFRSIYLENKDYMLYFSIL